MLAEVGQAGGCCRGGGRAGTRPEPTSAADSGGCGCSTRRGEAVDPRPTGWCRTVVTLAAAEAAGVARWCLATAVDYAKVREQFGQKIGEFRGGQAPCAEMLETAEAVTTAAGTWRPRRRRRRAQEQWLRGGRGRCGRLLTGRSRSPSRASRCSGIGFTFEHDAHLYLRWRDAARAVGDADEAAGRLTDAAVAGVRRRVHLDLDGRDDAVRAEVRDRRPDRVAAPRVRPACPFVETGYHAALACPYGLGADPVTQVVIDQELARAGLSRPDIVIAGWALPTILEHGTDEQRERFGSTSLLGDLVWCQLFSEPGAGPTWPRCGPGPVIVDGGWRLTARRWNSVAERADWGICLAGPTRDARSTGASPRGARRHAEQPRYRRAAAARDHRPRTGSSTRCFDDVFVPDEMVVGEVDDGWRLARPRWPTSGSPWARPWLSHSTERALELAAGITAAQRVQVGPRGRVATVCSLLGVRSTMRSSPVGRARAECGCCLGPQPAGRR